MKMRYVLTMKWRALLSCVVLMALPAFALPQTSGTQTEPEKKPELTAELKAEIITGISEIIDKRAFVPGLDFKKWNELIVKHQSNFDNAKDENQFVTAVNRALREFGISHVGLRTPRSAEARRGSGVAVTGHGLSAEKTEKGLKVLSITPQSPADNAGLKSGDLIIAVNGQPVQDITTIPSSDGTPVTLTIINSTGRELNVPLVAKQFVTSTTDSITWIDEDTALIRIRSFSRGYERANIEKLVKEAQNGKRLLIDLRNNGGGAVSNLGHLLGLFIASDQAVGTFVNRQNEQKYLAETKDSDPNVIKIADWLTQKFRPYKNRNVADLYKGKVAVLVNRGSASASEIFAAAMQDVAGAKVIGAATRGAVLASTYGRLPGGYELQFPVSDYVTIKGVRLEGNPVKPDVEAAGRDVDGQDAAITAAIKATS